MAIIGGIPYFQTNPYIYIFLNTIRWLNPETEDEMTIPRSWAVPSGYVKIAIENGP